MFQTREVGKKAMERNIVVIDQVIMIVNDREKNVSKSMQDMKLIY